MKKIIVIVLLSLTFNALSFADGLKLTGNVGGYAVEMFIDSADNITGEFSGEYRYLNQENYLTIKGQNLDDVIYIEEFYLENQTGTFYLENDSETITGVWVNGEGTITYEVMLRSSDNNYDFISRKSLEEYNAESSESISGTYKVSHNFINDYFVTEDNPVYEIGFNGGTASFEELEDGKLKFEIELICGPTYHFALAEGVAVKKDDVYVFSESLWDEDICEITFKFENKTVYATSNNGFACGFGARAYMDHILIKVED